MSHLTINKAQNANFLKVYDPILKKVITYNVFKNPLIIGSSDAVDLKVTLPAMDELKFGLYWESNGISNKSEMKSSHNSSIADNYLSIDFFGEYKSTIYKIKLGAIIRIHNIFLMPIFNPALDNSVSLTVNSELDKFIIQEASQFNPLGRKTIELHLIDGSDLTLDIIPKNGNSKAPPVTGNGNIKFLKDKDVGEEIVGDTGVVDPTIDIGNANIVESSVTDQNGLSNQPCQSLNSQAVSEPLLNLVENEIVKKTKEIETIIEGRSDISIKKGVGDLGDLEKRDLDKMIIDREVLKNELNETTKNIKSSSSNGVQDGLLEISQSNSLIGHVSQIVENDINIVPDNICVLDNNKSENIVTNNTFISENTLEMCIDSIKDNIKEEVLQVISNSVAEEVSQNINTAVSDVLNESNISQAITDRILNESRDLIKLEVDKEISMSKRLKIKEDQVDADGRNENSGINSKKDRKSTNNNDKYLKKTRDGSTSQESSSFDNKESGITVESTSDDIETPSPKRQKRKASIANEKKLTPQQKAAITRRKNKKVREAAKNK